MLATKTLTASIASVLLGTAAVWAQWEPPTPSAPAPLAESTILTRIAFGSCADEEARQPIWKAIARENPDLFLFIGDNVYSDYNRGGRVETPGPAELDYSYDRLAKNEDFVRFFNDVPMLVTWDDHDFGMNDAGVEFAPKGYAKDKMFEFFGYPDETIKDRDGVYYSKSFGAEGQRVQIIMLDTRWFRDPLKTKDPAKPGRSPYIGDPDPSKTMLGEAQWAWLAEELAKPADLRLIVSSIQVLADGHHYEAWYTLPTERQKLFDTVKKAGADRVVFLSGDRHIGGLYRQSDVLGYSAHEITSSSLNLSFSRDDVVPEVGPHQLGRMYGPENYGLVSVDWAVGELRFDVKGAQGVTARTLTIPFEQIER